MALVKLNNRGVRNVSTFGSVAGGSLTFIKKLTASSDSTISFVDGSSDVVLDDTYKEYLFTFINIHPATDNVHFSFNMSVDTGSNYNVAKTSTAFDSYHLEADTYSGVAYEAGVDLAQSTDFQFIQHSIGNDNDENVSGELKIFLPSSTTFVKHFISDINGTSSSGYAQDYYIAGYGNTTSAVDAIQFKFSSGNIDAGTIKLYGVT